MASRNPRRSSILKFRNSIGPEGSSGGPNIGNGRQNDECTGNMTTNVPVLHPKRVSFSGASQVKEFGNNSNSSGEGSLSSLSKSTSFNQTSCNMTMTFAGNMDMDFEEYECDKKTQEVPKDLCRTMLNAGDMSTIENQNLDEGQCIPKKLTPSLPIQISYSGAPQPPQVKEFGNNSNSSGDGFLPLSKLTSFNQTCNMTMTSAGDMDMVEEYESDKKTREVPKNLCRTMLNAGDMSTIENQNLDEGQCILKKSTPPLPIQISYSGAPQPQLKEFGSSNSTAKRFNNNNGTDNALISNSSIRPPQLHFSKKHQPEECRGILYGRVRSKPLENKQADNPSCFGPFGSSKTPVRRKFQGEEVTQQSTISTAVIEKLVQAVQCPPKDVFEHLNLLVSIKDNLIEMPQNEWKEIAGRFDKFLGTNYIESVDIDRRTEHSTDPLLRMGLKLGRERRQRKRQELSLAK